MKTKWICVAMLAGVMLATLWMMLPRPAAAVTCGTWIGGAAGSWSNTANWACGAVPTVADAVRFDSGGAVTVTNIPTQSIAQLLLSNSTAVNLQANAASTVLTIAGALGTDLDVPSGSALNVNGAITLTVFVGTLATGSVSGSMTCSAAAHKLDAQDASAITFNSGATFTQATGCSGNAFTNGGTANAIVFTSGSTFIQQHTNAGNPFGLAVPNSKVAFQGGSLYRHEQTGAPSFSGRTYANFELNFATYTANSTGGSKFTVDNLTVTAGAIGLNLTGGIDIKGNVSVAPGATLNFNPASANAINFNGSSAQAISGSGTITFANNANVTINNAAGVTLNRDVTLNSALALTSGDLTTGANILTLGPSATVTGAGDVVGTVRRTSFSGAQTYNNQYTTLNFTSAPGANVDVTLTKSPPAGLTLAVSRYYTITATDGVSATVQLAYKSPGDVNGTTEADNALWRYDTNLGRWVFQGGVVNTTDPTWHYVSQFGVTQFSQWAITNNGGPTAVTLSSFKASAPTFDLGAWFANLLHQWRR